MPVSFDEKNKVFNVYTKNFSLVFGIFKEKVPVLIYSGKRIKNTYDMDKRYAWYRQNKKQCRGHCKGNR